MAKKKKKTPEIWILEGEILDTATQEKKPCARVVVEYHGPNDIRVIEKERFMSSEELEERKKVMSQNASKAVSGFY